MQAGWTGLVRRPFDPSEMRKLLQQGLLSFISLAEVSYFWQKFHNCGRSFHICGRSPLVVSGQKPPALQQQQRGGQRPALLSHLAVRVFNEALHFCRRSAITRALTCLAASCTLVKHEDRRPHASLLPLPSSKLRQRSSFFLLLWFTFLFFLL